MRRSLNSSIRPILTLLAVACSADRDIAGPDPEPTSPPAEDATELVALESSGTGNDTECMGTLSGTFDNIVVPPGASCFLQAATVNGDVRALEGSRLFFRSSSAQGNIEGDKADRVDLIQLTNAPRNLVLGSIRVKDGAAFARVCGTDLPNGSIQIQKMGTFVMVGGALCSGLGGGNTLAKGHIKIKDNNILMLPGFSGLDVRDNDIGGNVQVFRNVGPGLKTVQANTVREALLCFENEAPFVGGPNTAGNAIGECF